jgi:hypothetical protein
MSAQEIAQVVTEYGSAFRLDWGNVDGRWVRDNMNDIAMWVRSPGTFLSLEEARRSLDLCPAGEGHWTEHCYARCEVQD